MHAAALRSGSFICGRYSNILFLSIKGPVDLMNVELDSIANSCERYGLRLNHGKTKRLCVSANLQNIFFNYKKSIVSNGSHPQRVLVLLLMTGCHLMNRFSTFAEVTIWVQI